MTTMNDKYGDGSKHTVCEKCGLCITCGDCQEHGCAEMQAKLHAAPQHHSNSEHEKRIVD